jgi:hypothetical protein
MSGKRIPQCPGEPMILAPLYAHLVLLRLFLLLFIGDKRVKATSPVLGKQTGIATNMLASIRNGVSPAEDPAKWEADKPHT